MTANHLKMAKVQVIQGLQAQGWSVRRIARERGISRDTVQRYVAMELALELMDQGSCQVEASDEGLMTEDIEACLRPVLKAIRECDLSAAEVTTWCAEMLQADRVGFICEQELRELRQHSEASPSA